MAERPVRALEVRAAVQAAKKIQAVGTKTIPSNSGGVVLSSGKIISVSLKALSGNAGDLYVGGPKVPPYSGAGFVLEPGEAWNIDVDNLNEVQLFAEVSGDIISYGALRQSE